jgi:carbon-monoxide dehydrogenase medium subunit
MYPNRFSYHRAKNIEDALTVLNQNKDEIKVLAGGQSLIPLMKLRLASPARLLDIGRLQSLTGIRTENGILRIGALCRHADLDRVLPPDGLEIFPEAARVIADPQVRNVGTVGGALAEADPAGDWGAVLLALDASVACRSADGERRVALKDFFTDVYTTALKAEEILTEVQVALPPARTGSAYLKLERKSGDFAIVSAGVIVQAGEKDTIERIGIGLSGVGLTPIKAGAAERVLKGKEFSDGLLEKAGETVMGEIQPFSDMRGSEDYKRDVAGTLFKRAFLSAWHRGLKQDG